MPSYEYRCDDCGTELHVRQTDYVYREEICKACGKKMRKKFSAYNFIFSARMKSLESLE